MISFVIVTSWTISYVFRNYDRPVSYCDYHPPFADVNGTDPSKSFFNCRWNTKSGWKGRKGRGCRRMLACVLIYSPGQLSSARPWVIQIQKLWHNTQFNMRKPYVNVQLQFPLGGALHRGIMPIIPTLIPGQQSKGVLSIVHGIQSATVSTSCELSRSMSIPDEPRAWNYMGFLSCCLNSIFHTFCLPPPCI